MNKNCKFEAPPKSGAFFMQLFYSEDLKSINQTVTLDSQESIHLAKVLRKQIGDLVHITNGKGVLFETEIISINKKACSLEAKSILQTETKQSDLTIAIAPTKNITRTEWFIEKSVELGIGKIDLFVSNNSERRAVKLERLQLKALSAMKQSLKFFLTPVAEAKKFKKLVDDAKSYDIKLIAYVEEKQQSIVKEFYPNKKTIVLIGPEGGFSVEEILYAKENGFKTVSLGKSRLRTETAGLYVASVYNALT